MGERSKNDEENAMNSGLGLDRLLRGLLLVLFLLTTTLAFGQSPYLAVNGMEHDYLTLNYYIDEDEGLFEEVLVEFWPNDSNVEEAQLWSNLNRRDYATLDDQDPSSVPAPSPSGTNYFVGIPLNDVGGGKWEATLPINKTGAYRLTGRYRRAGESEWQWVGGRDTAIMVSPHKARDVILYELQVNVINATGDTEGTRSTFEDLMNPSSNANLDYFENLGVNTLWIQPIHPIGDHPCVDKSQGPGSPYSIQNMWEVAPHMGDGNTRESAMEAFQDFAAEAGARGIDFFFDIIFNHTSWDAEIGRDPDDPTQPAANPNALIADILPNWYSRYVNGTHLPCDEYGYNQDDFHFWLPARNEGEMGPAPAERNDFGKWPDVTALFWGTYPALFEVTAEDDTYWDISQPGSDVRRMTEYFAYFGTYWIEKSGGTLGGFRCDYAQGLPPQAWEYFVNKIRQTKWDFLFMAESLDGGPVSQRAGRHMDIINQNWVWQVLGSSGNTMEIRGIIDENKTDYGFAGIMRGLINHDQNAPEDRWWTFSRYAAGAVVDGAPQMYQGQELGYEDNVGFSIFRFQFGRWIPDIFKWHNMQALWNNRDGLLEEAYSRLHHARMANPATRTHDQWYLDQTSGGAHDRIFSVLKYDRFGWDPAHQNVMLNFVNLDPWNERSGTFALSGVDAIALDPSRNYNIRNLMGDDPNDYLWAGEGRTGQDLLDNGISVTFPSDGNGNVGTAFVQMLVLEQDGGNEPPEPPSGLEWIGNVRHEPVNGQIGPADEIVVFIESWPEGEAVGGNVVFSPDGETWYEEELVFVTAGAGSFEQNDLWSANIGSFAACTEIEYAVMLEDDEEEQSWANNNGDNYFAVVECGAPIEIDVPPSNTTVGHETETFTLEGTSEGILGDLTWSNALTGASGTITGAATWTLENIALAVGANIITVSGEVEGSGTDTIAADDSTNYGAGWADGDNEGTGFGPWQFNHNQDPTNSFAGVFIGPASNAGISGMGDSAFGFYANPPESDANAEVIRDFSSPMPVGSVFSFQWGLNWDSDDENSFRGFSLSAGTTELLYINMSDSSEIRINGDPMFSNYGTEAMTLHFEYLASESIRVWGTGRDGSETYDETLTVPEGAPSQIKFYFNASSVPDEPDQDNRQMYVDNLQITQEGSGEPQTVTASVTITRQSDSEPPEVGLEITDPAANITVPNTTGTYTVSGTAEGISGTLSWVNQLNGVSGTTTAGATWSIPGIPLAVGDNVITVSEGGDGMIASDNAGNYSEWTSGSNQGTGFDPWQLNVGGEEAGTFLGASEFGLWSHSGGHGIDAIRPFAAPLAEGQTFSVRMRNGWIWEEGGSVGVALRNAAGDTIWELYFNGGETYYLTPEGETDIAWTAAGINISFTLTGPNTYSVTINPDGSDGQTITGTISGEIAQFRAWSWNNGTDDGENSNRDFFFNNLSIVDSEAVASVTITRQAGSGQDSNLDGVPDWWYDGLGLDPTTPNLGGQMTPSGYTHREAYLLNINPNDDEVPMILMHMGTEGRFAFQAPGENRRYVVQHTPSLDEEFVDIGEGIDVTEEIELNGDPMGFYRVRFLDGAGHTPPGNGGEESDIQDTQAQSRIEGENNDTWIDAAATPPGAATNATLFYQVETTAGAGLNAWVESPMERNPGMDEGDWEWWSFNIGELNDGDTVEFYVVMTDGEGVSVTEDNNGQNHGVVIGDDNGETEDFEYIFGTDHYVSPENVVWIDTAAFPENSSQAAYIVYCIDPPCSGDWPLIPMDRNEEWENGDWWHISLGQHTNGTVIEFAVMIVDHDGVEHWDSNNGANYTVTIGGGGGNGGEPGGMMPPSTNPTFGEAGTVTIDGVNTGNEWNNDNLIALNLANSDPRSLGGNWTMHEAPANLTHMWARWDDDNLYLAWQFVDITDILDPSNAGSAAGGSVYNSQGILQFISIDTGPGGAADYMWDKLDSFVGSTLPNVQIAMRSDLWGDHPYLSKAVGGEFVVDEDLGVNYFTRELAGIEIAKSQGFVGTSLYGVPDIDDYLDDSNVELTDYFHHDHSRNTFYEMAVPLSTLGITRSHIESNGIGVFISAGADSAVSSIPFDNATLDTPGTTDSNSSFEWEDGDEFSVPFARIGGN